MMMKAAPIPAQLTLAALLAVAAAPMPYGYYTLVRWLACIGFVWLAYAAATASKSVWSWVFGLLAVLFNPLAKIHMPKGAWAAVDLAAAAIVAWHAYRSWRQVPR